MPSFLLFAPLIRAARNADRRSAAWRALVAALLLCVGLQSALLPAQRTPGSAHVHLDGQFPGAHDVETLRAAPGGNAVHREPVDDDDDDDHDAGHGHVDIGHHTHADDRTDVVYIGEDMVGTEATPAVSSKRSALDFDGLWSASAPFATAGPAGVVLTAEAQSYRSHVAPRLERPPRANA